MPSGTMTRYEYIGGNSKKYWEIEKPFADGGGGGWVVRVRFGRIGTGGQVHINVFSTEFHANAHYEKKVSEKIGKGYKNVSGAVTKQLMGTPAVIKTKEKPACEHLQLRKTGEFRWECNACKTHIEFDKLQKPAAVEEVTQVRRFIDLSALRG